MRLIREIDIDDEELGIKEWSVVDRPATGINFALFKGRKPEAVEDCVAALVADPDFDAGDFETPEERAWAVCQAEFGKEAGVRKQEEMTPEMAEETPEGMGVEAAVPEVTGTVEIPTSPQRFPVGDCIGMAMEQGFGRDESIGLCQMLAQTYGDPEDPDTVMLPEGTTPEGLVNQLAVEHGVAVPQGTTPGGGEEGKGIPGNIWAERYARALGVPKPTATEKSLARLSKEVRKMRGTQEAQEKRSQELMGVLHGLMTIIAQDRGIDPAKLPPIGEAPPAEAEAAADESGGAEAAPAPAAADAKSETPEEEMARLREENARLNAIVSGGGEAAAAVGADAGGDGDALEPPAVAAAAPYIGGQDIPSDGPEPILKPGMPAEEPQKRGRASAPPPAATKRTADDTYGLTLLGGARVDRSDLRDLGWDNV